MTARRYNLTDRLLGELEHALRVVVARPRAARPAPDAEQTGELSSSEQQLGASLMRVNHAGEIAAQALYRGQAAVARDDQQRQELLTAAGEEHDHLAWCRDRAEALGGRISMLTPFWYAGSFALGTAAGLAGDKISLGFLAETERQVTAHLDEHLQRLPEKDANSRAILEQMRAEEIKHGQIATDRGGRELPKAIKTTMRTASKVMTTISFRL